ncbi:hypothetical protein A11A3_05654 [Alcanivorax hongdengensis A-11-3]|uniref:DUF1800 domain-containing protein n=1 Tax=Alcanivorax hongdengensis A-11-3 TaxID=1177179 RepID=L0WE91_9GAMM|nr:DUF1800 domain-containing protein [Alcanivorax hongdengensis]EKF75153.1 hypothetical protein A11A3_05654 [Alcanivorax hongdengensis A-11-3]
MPRQLDLALIAANRFGLGAGPGELDDIAHDPREWVLSQLQTPPLADKALAALPSSEQYQQQIIEWRQQRKKANRESRKPAQRQTFSQRFNADFVKEINLRAAQQCATTTPVTERLVMFWSNHFTISDEKQPLKLLAGAMEREAIRPRVCGNFTDMLLAVEQHPAMLIYLDNQQSTGPDSKVAMKRARQKQATSKTSINENLAREIMELHTLSSEGGYSQADVIALAEGITGWRPWLAARKAQPLGPYGSRFAPAFHQPGERQFLGRRFAQKGAAQGEAMLRHIAMDPHTARFISFKLCRQFVSDKPPPDLVDTLADTFRKHDGDLMPVYRALFESDLAWQPDQRKFRRPDEYLIALHRALAIDLNPKQPGRWRQEMHLMGQNVFRPGSPAGWPDSADNWIGADAIWKRFFVASRYSGRLPSSRDAMELARDSLGPRLGNRTSVAISEARNRRQATALVLASPEFQWR